MKNPGLIFNKKGDDLTMGEKIKYGMLTFFLTPFLPLILSLKLQNRYLMESTTTKGDELYEQKAELKRHLYSIAKLELGFEAIYQIGEEHVIILLWLKDSAMVSVQHYTNSEESYDSYLLWDRK